MTHRIIYLAERLLIALGLSTALALLPLPLRTPALIVHVHIPLVVFLLVCYIGKLLIDTFFYDRHP
jgi:hypothetical protein